MSNSKYIYGGCFLDKDDHCSSDVVSSSSLKDIENKLISEIHNDDNFMICRYGVLPNGKPDPRRFYGYEIGIVSKDPVISYVGDVNFKRPSSYKKVYCNRLGQPRAYLLGYKNVFHCRENHFTPYPYDISQEVNK